MQAADGCYPHDAGGDVRTELGQLVDDYHARRRAADAEIDRQSANDRQEGGEHYRKLKIQTWDYIAANGIGYFEGNIIKYVSRWKDKGGLEDLRKAKHYLDKLIEVSE
jgi:hypothetical protein